MSKFNITKKVKLFDLLGEGHEQSVLEFKPMTFADARQLNKLQDTTDYTPEIPEGADEATIKQLKVQAQAKENEAALKSVDKAIEFIKGKFIKGSIAGTDVSADDFTNGELPVDVINYCMKELAGGAKPEGFTQG